MSSQLWNLNELAPYEKDGKYARPQSSATCGNVTAIFDDLKETLIAEIQRWPAVVACVAWLTEFEILNALATRDAVQIVLSKEDFLRPDVGGMQKEKLRAAYLRLKFPFSRYDELPQVFHLSCASDPCIEPVRCCGVFDTNRSRPRQHNKFAVFCDLEIDELVSEFTGEPYTLRRLIPRTVWTGSFNWTVNATLSFENAVLIRDEQIANAYFAQWGHILAVSERLDWTSQYAEPEWTTGT